MRCCASFCLGPLYTVQFVRVHALSPRAARSRVGRRGSKRRVAGGLLTPRWVDMEEEGGGKGALPPSLRMHTVRCEPIRSLPPSLHPSVLPFHPSDTSLLPPRSADTRKAKPTGQQDGKHKESNVHPHHRSRLHPPEAWPRSCHGRRENRLASVARHHGAATRRTRRVLGLRGRTSRKYSNGCWCVRCSLAADHEEYPYRPYLVPRQRANPPLKQQYRMGHARLARSICSGAHLQAVHEDIGRGDLQRGTVDFTHRVASCVCRRYS